MSKSQTLNNKRYDLEERTFDFASNVRDYVIKLPKTLPNIEYGKQLSRSSGSVGANYIEANEALSKKDFVMRIKICRKEAKESRYWIQLTCPISKDLGAQVELINEATEFVKIFSAIIVKSV